MRRAERVHDPDSLFAMRDKRTYADDRMINVLRKLIADRFKNFGVRLATEAVRRREARQICSCAGAWHRMPAARRTLFAETVGIRIRL